MKAIILAAGMGTRLGKYTKNMPKCMLEFNGKTLIQRQVETLLKSGIKDILIVGGYKPEKIDISGVSYLENKDFDKTNMVETLMKARQEMLNSDRGVLVCYSDIIYEQKLIETILKQDSSISVLADTEWIDYWKSRMENWLEDVESFRYDEKNCLIDIGTPNCSLDNAKSRYIGIIKFSKEGIKQLIDIYDKNRKKYYDKDQPWMRSKSFKNAYMTCMLQAMIDEKIEVSAVFVKHGWLEFDNVEDYEKANSWLKEKSLGRFIKLEDD